MKKKDPQNKQVRPLMHFSKNPFPCWPSRKHTCYIFCRQLIIVYLFKNNEFSNVETKQLLATISEPIKKKVMNTYEKILAEGKTEGFKLKEYEVVKKAYAKNRTPAEIADWLDISIEKVKSIIDAIKKEGEN